MYKYFPDFFPQCKLRRRQEIVPISYSNRDVQDSKNEDKVEACRQPLKQNVSMPENLGKRRSHFLSILLMRTSFNTSKERWTSPWNRYQIKTCFVSDVSVNQTTGRRWQIKLLDTWKVPQIHLLSQDSVNCPLFKHTASGSQWKMCSYNCECCFFKTEAADQTYCLIQLYELPY